MPLEDVFIQEMDRATSKLETVRINLDRQFLMVELDEEGHWRGSPALYHWQNGRWYDTGGNEITDLERIPRKFRQEIEDNPVTVRTEGPRVTAVCKFCGEKMNSSEIEQHYIAHVQETLAQAGQVQPPADPKQKITPKHDANQHARS